jgi:hypothetical protein
MEGREERFRTNRTTSCPSRGTQPVKDQDGAGLFDAARIEKGQTEAISGVLERAALPAPAGGGEDSIDEGRTAC